MLFNRYSYENSRSDNAAAQEQFTYDPFPILFIEEGTDLDFSYTFVFNKIQTAKFFSVAAPPEHKSQYPTLNAQWNPDEWFENELAPTTSWFDSIASTLSASAHGQPGSL
jgi:hypothetical protein